MANYHFNYVNVWSGRYLSYKLSALLIIRIEVICSS